MSYPKNRKEKYPVEEVIEQVKIYPNVSYIGDKNFEIICPCCGKKFVENKKTNA